MMKSLIILLCVAVALSCGAAEKINLNMRATEKAIAEQDALEYMVLTGKLLEQEYVPDIHPVGCIDKLCMSNFYLYHIMVEDVIVGDIPEKKIKAARYQHGEYLFRSSQTALFVVSIVKDEKYKELLGTSFALEEHSKIQTKQCMSESSKKHLRGLEDFDGCFSFIDLEIKENPIASHLRGKIFVSVIKEVKEQLTLASVLKSFDDYHLSDGTVIVDTAEKEDQCNHIDFDKEDNDPNCDFTKYYNLLQYQVKKGQGEHAMALFKQELTASKLSLNALKLRYAVVEYDEFSEFQVHYKY